MKILTNVPVLTEIGPLDHIEKFPMVLRKRYGMKSPCAICRKEITDDFMIGGFKAGHRNMMFHERCANEQGIAVKEEGPSK